MNDAQPVNVLFATDGSAHSRAAESLLAGLHWPRSASVTVVAALRQRWTLLGLGLDSDAEVQDTVMRLQRVARGAAEATAHAAARRLGEAGLATRRVIREGEPSQVVLGVAAEARSHLIALGAKGFDQTNALRLGSTAREVLEAAPASVLVARPGRRDRPARVIVAADGLLDWLTPHAWPIALLPPTAEVTVAKLAVEPDAPGQDEEAELRALEFAEALQARGLKARNVFPQGEPRAELVRLARASQADLVLVGRQPALTVAGAAPQALALAVARYAPCSVLVVQPGSNWTRGPAGASDAQQAARTAAAFA